MESRKEAKVAPEADRESSGSQMYPTLAKGQIRKMDEPIIKHEKSATSGDPMERYTKKWIRRLRFMLCCPASEPSKQPIEDVASLLGELFHDPKVSFSEIMAGLILASKYQEAQRKWILKNRRQGKSEIIDFLSGIPITKETKFLNLAKPEDSLIINELEYYLYYSHATFGYHLLTTEQPVQMWCCNPYLRLKSCFSSADNKNNKNSPPTATGESNKSEREFDTTVRGDNFFGFNEAGSRFYLDRYNCELIHVSYETDINVVPFLVAADHTRQTIVVAIRGSSRLHDAITDTNYHFDKLPIENCPDDWLGHRGNTSAAVYVKTSLLGDQILERAFNCRPDLNSHNYKLVICGESLGAATGAILGVLLRPLYPTLKAYLYSPPGGILSLPVVEYTKEFAVGLIVGFDIIARAGLTQFERSRYQACWALSTSGKCSRGVLARSLCPCSCFGTDRVEYEPGQSLDMLYGTDVEPLSYKNVSIPFQKHPLMFYAPGRLIHLVRNCSFRTRTKQFWRGPIYQGVWTDNRDYDRILIDKRMFSDHLPWNVRKALSAIRYRTSPGLADPSK